jgi:hypothetical protein
MKQLQALIFSLLMGVAVAAQALDQDVQVDLLMSKIITADKEGRAADALPSFAKLESMEPTLKKPLSEGFHYLYITALDNAGDHVNALRRANIYMEKFGNRGKNYPKVVEIMSRLQDQVASEEKEAAERKAGEERDVAKWKGYFFQGGMTWMPVNAYRTKTWDEANAYCVNTTINGQTGWRLPMKDELNALYASGVSLTMYHVWSSTRITDADSVYQYYCVDMQNGHVGKCTDREDDINYTCVHFGRLR